MIHRDELEIVNEASVREALKDLVARAAEMGMSKAAFVSPADIIVDEQLAGMCENPKCPNYGLGGSCPPHVSGPAGFRKRLEHALTGLVFYMEVPMEILMSPEKKEIYQHLHKTASGLEKIAISRGFSESRAFAGGSCRHLFCAAESHCRVVDGTGECRHSETARSSMSGYGINVFALCERIGRPLKKITKNTNADEADYGVTVGLLIIQ